MFNLFKKKEEKCIRQVAVESLVDMIDEYSEWYDQAGLYLPPAYATNPTEWTEVLHKIVRAFELMKDYQDGVGDLYQAELMEDSIAVNKFTKEIKLGFKLFGENLMYLTDKRQPLIPAH